MTEYKLGATQVSVGENFRWVVLADPAGAIRRREEITYHQD